MERNYINECKKHGCSAKVFCKYKNSMKDRIGSADLMILFTHTVSHKMVGCALDAVKDHTRIVRSHKSSLASLKEILAENVATA